MALVGDDPKRRKALEDNLDRLLKDLETAPAEPSEPVSPEGADASFRLQVSPDRLSACVDLFPPAGEGRSLEWLPLMDELNAQGLVALLADDLPEAVERCNAGSVQRGVLVAQGIPPKPSREARLEVLFALEPPPEERPLQEDAQGHVDFRERGRILAVQEGDLLAVLEPAEPGSPGVDVFGVPIPVDRPKDLRLIPGKGVAQLEDGKTYAATQMGQPVLDGLVLRVDPVYVVSRDVDSLTGNVHFDGSVVVRGNVREGFSVTAGVDLEVFGNAEGARIQAVRDVVLHGGVIGPTTQVEAGRDVRVRFVEQGILTADRDILVGQYVLHGSLSACGSILVQSRKGVLGGRLEAFDRIDTYTAGTPLGTRTHLVAGTHFRVRRQLSATEQRIAELEAQAAKIGGVIKGTMARYTRDGRPALPPELRERMEKLLQHYNRLVEESRVLDGRRTALESLLRPQPSATKGVVKVRGSAYPGVLVEIRGMRREILDEQKYVTFYLDGERGELTFGPYL